MINHLNNTQEIRINIFLGDTLLGGQFRIRPTHGLRSTSITPEARQSYSTQPIGLEVLGLRFDLITKSCNIVCALNRFLSFVNLNGTTKATDFEHTASSQVGLSDEIKYNTNNPTLTCIKEIVRINIIIQKRTTKFLRVYKHLTQIAIQKYYT